jgi:hypothetical protein
MSMSGYHSKPTLSLEELDRGIARWKAKLTGQILDAPSRAIAPRTPAPWVGDEPAIHGDVTVVRTFDLDALEDEVTVVRVVDDAIIGSASGALEIERAA